MLNRLTGTVRDVEKCMEYHVGSTCPTTS